MSPAKFHEDHDRPYERSKSSNKDFINGGPRPSPLKISKESYTIHKSSYSPFSSFSSSTSTSLPGVVHNVDNKQQQQQRQPVIIYTHSPKVIHTQARDFMALVQKLTGLSSSTSHNDDQEQEESNNNKNPNLGHNETDENHDDSSSVSHVTNPLFSPNSTDFFCPPRPMHRFSDYTSPNSNNPISPSVLEFIKELP